MLLDSEKTMENAVGVDFASSRFGPKMDFTSKLTGFYVFFAKRLRSQFSTRWVAIFLAQKEPQNASIPCRFATWGEKGPGCKAAFFWRGGRMRAPQESKFTALSCVA